MLVTDLVGSTPLARRFGDVWPTVLARHNELVTSACESHGGVCTAALGDGALFVFERGAEAAAAAWELARRIDDEPWPDDAIVRVRSGLHRGPIYETLGTFSGVTIHEAARVAALAGSGRVVLTDAVREEIEPPPTGSQLTDLGMHDIRDFPDPVRLFCLDPVGSSPGGVGRTAPLHVATPFLGRTSDLEGVRTQLGAARLVTIVGPGGIGKTRLASELMRHHPGDAVFADLTRLDPAGDVEAFVGDVVRRGDAPANDLTSLIGARSLMLVLDNCEHVAAPVSVLCEHLLASCSRLSIVATSRVALRLEEEHPWFLAPLAEPDAVELFLARAEDAVGRSRVADLDRTDVAAVCARVDSIPLAIELAAGRLRSLGLSELRSYMDEQMSLLVDRGRPGNERQRAMSATIEWSYRGLDDDERAVFGALSLFRGGATRDAVGALVTDVDGFALLDIVDELVSRSLVAVDDGADGRTRYLLMEPIRQFAETTLTQDDRSVLADRHAEWVCRRVPLVASDLLTRPGARRELHAEAANIGEAIRHLVAVGDVAAAIRLVGLLGYFWLSERPAEGWALTRLAFDASTGQEPPRHRAAALVTAGQLLERQLRFDEARSALVEAVELSADLHSATRGSALFWLGRTHAMVGHGAEARTTFEDAERAFSAAGDLLGQAWAQLWVADLTDDPIEARRLTERLVALARSEGLQHVLAPALLNLAAKFAFIDGDPERALDHIGEAIGIHEAVGDEWQHVDSSIGGASLAISFERPEAWELLRDASELMVDHVDEFHRRHFVGVAAEALRRRGRVDVAASLAWSVDERWRPPYEDFVLWIDRCRAGCPRPARTVSLDDAVRRAVVEVQQADFFE